MNNETGLRVCNNESADTCMTKHDLSSGILANTGDNVNERVEMETGKKRLWGYVEYIVYIIL